MFTLLALGHVKKLYQLCGLDIQVGINRQSYKQGLYSYQHIWILLWNYSCRLLILFRNEMAPLGSHSNVLKWNDFANLNLAIG